MVRPNPELAEALAAYVCVRVTDMREIDLSRFRFDYDLTLAIVLAHSDGTVYHRYGGRPADDPAGWMSVPSLTRLLVDTLDDHRAHRPTDVPGPAPTTVEDLPAFAVRGAKDGCVHCHSVHDVQAAQLILDEKFTRDDAFVWPDPIRIGLVLEPDDQTRIRHVIPDSAAARADLQANDRVLTFGDARPRTITDLQEVLDRTAPNGGTLALTVERDGERIDAALELARGWRRATPAEYAWRPYKWNLSPAPGFGGQALRASALRRLGLAEDAFAFKIGYFVDWGRNAHRGEQAKRAGLRKGDVVTAIDGRSDFAGIDHFHAWIRLTKQPGDEVDIDVRRGDDELQVRLALPR